MKSMLRHAPRNSLPSFAFLAAAVALGPGAPEPEARDASESDLAAIINVRRGQRRFTPEDIPAILRSMRRAGHVDFICWIDPDTGAFTVETGDDKTPHFDIRPGACPNHIEIEEVAVLRTGVLGNAFDVTQVDLGTLTLLSDNFFGDGQVEPTSTSLGDVGTPFVAELCDCHAAEGDEDTDVIADFDEGVVIETFGLDSLPNGTLVPLRIAGMLKEGNAIFSARDCVRITNHSD